MLTPIWQKYHMDNFNSYRCWTFQKQISICFWYMKLGKDSEILVLKLHFWFCIFWGDEDYCCPNVIQILSRFVKISTCYGIFNFSVLMIILVRKNLKLCKIIPETDIKNLYFKNLHSVAIYGRDNTIPLPPMENSFQLSPININLY